MHHLFILGSAYLQPFVTPSFFAVPARTSKAALAGICDGVSGQGSASHGTMVAEETKEPSSRKKIMSSGMSVFFIQKDRLCGDLKRNSMPPSAGMDARFPSEK